jgi:hypothetical protein
VHGGTAIAGAVGAGRSRRAVVAGACEIATLSATSALRREEIKLQVALISPLLHVKGYAAPETRLPRNGHVC